MIALALLAACTTEVPEQRTPDAVDLLGGSEVLLITPAALEEAWQPWVDWKNARGLPTAMITVEELDASEQGEDLAARIRAGLQRYAAQGTRFVVLGADAPLIPTREVSLWADAHLDDGYLVETFASELYYADLDGDWDSDGDGVYGEPEDAMDLMPDLVVSRLPARSSDQVSGFVDKVFAYERWPLTDYQDRALLMGEWAGTFSGFDFYSSSAQEALILPHLPSDFEVTRLYEQYDQYEGALDNTRQTQKDAFNRGQGFVLNFGHGSASTLSNLSLDDLWQLDNTDRPMLLATVECFGCAFDDPSPDHVACEAFVLAEGGGVAYLGNTTYGIGFPSLTDFYILFVEGLYEGLEDGPIASTFGEAMVDTQRAFPTAETLAAEGHTDRWTQMALVMVGDPTVEPWLGTPTALSLEEDAEGCWKVRADDQPAEGVSVTLYGPGEVQWRSETGADGVACTGTHPQATSVTAWRRGAVPAERTL